MIEKEVVDANKTAESDSDVMDKILDEAGMTEGQEDPSSSKDGAEETKDQDTGVDQSKKANLDKDTEAESGPEAKLAKIKEILGDDEKAIDAYIKSKGYHTDPAWQKLLAKSKMGVVDEETQKQLDDFKKVTSSREYIETKMKSEGYKQEAIDAELLKRGFQVESKGQDDVELVIKSLGIDPKGMDDNTRATISDVAKVVDVILKDRLGKALPERIKPLEETITSINREKNASKIQSQMKSIVETEGVLDYAKDIIPAIADWLEKNPDAQQEDVFNYFLQLNHSLGIERLKTGKKRADNQDVKNSLRKVTKQMPASGATKPKRSDYADDDSYMDAILDAHGAQ